MTATAERRTHQRGAAVEERILDVTRPLLTDAGDLFTVETTPDVARRAGSTRPLSTDAGHRSPARRRAIDDCGEHDRDS